MSEPERISSLRKLTSVLPFKTQTIPSPTINLFGSISSSNNNTSNNNDNDNTASSGGKKTSRPSDKLSPMMLKGLGFDTEKRRRSVRPIQSSVNSSITFTDLDYDSSGVQMEDAPAMPARVRRNVSMDEDSKPLRPYRRESSASASVQLDYLKSDYKDSSSRTSSNSRVRDQLVSSVNSSITFADFQDLNAFLGHEFLAEPSPPPPSIRRAVSVDSDSKPLRPLRRESHIAGETDYHQFDYPEPNKRNMSLDSQPAFPSRRESVGVDSLSSLSRSAASTSSRDYRPCAPDRKTSLSGPTARVKGTSVDSQPCAPNRKTSMSHSVMDVCEEEEEGEEEALEKDAVPAVDRALTSTDTEMMSVTSAVA